jgi:hypothetical protein
VKTVQLESEVGDDGILSLRIPLGATEAQKRVLVTIQPLPSLATGETGTSDWSAFVAQTYGSCAGMNLEEPDDLPLEQREWPE